MIAFALYLIVGHTRLDGAKGGLLVNSVPQPAEWKGVAFRFEPDGIGFIGSAGELTETQLGLTKQVANGFTYLFDRGLWQDDKIAKQSALYEELQASANGSLGSITTAWLKSVVPSANAQQGRLFDEWRLTFDEEGKRVVVDLKGGCGLQVAAPPPVVPCVVPGEETPWVRYPTQYGFYAYGQVKQEGLGYAAQEGAIKALDAHLDEFMAKRDKARLAIAARRDGFANGNWEGKGLNQLPSGLQERIRKSASPIPPGARLIQAEVSLYLEVTAEKTVDLEVP